MPVLEYLDFDVAVEQTADGYRARVFGSPAGEGSAGVILPFDETQVKDVLLRVQDAREGFTGAADIREATLDGIRSFGATLFESAFRDVVGALLGASLATATSQGKGLRLRLRLDPSLSDVPWEYLYNRPLDRFLCLSAETPVVRYLEVPEPVSATRVVRPLRVLVMISDPADYPALDVEGEWDRLTGALDELIREGLVAVDRLDDASLPALHERLTASPYHVFHFIGHGGFDRKDEDGLLLLEGPGGAVSIVPGADLATALLDARLKLAVLNTCEGARASARDPFSGTAQALVRQGIPAVVAMQFEISDDAARDLSQQFYEGLAMGFPVDAALAEARKAVYFTGNRVEWATPVLYMRSPDGRIFDVEGTGRLVAPRAEVDPLAPADRDRTTPPLIVFAGDLALQLEDPSGALIRATQPETRPVPRLRRPPVDLRPKDLPGLVGREAEVRALAETFLNDRSRPPIEVTGPDGAGKTALLRNVAHHPSAQFRDGAVYSSSPQPVPDLLQFLFQTFYESAAPVKPTEAELRIQLHQVQALVELDDVYLSREELQLLANVAPNVQLLLASRERVLWEDGPAFPLRGLSEEAAVQLLERRIGRRLTEEEISPARTLSRELGGLPLALIKAAARVRDGGLPLEQVARESVAPPPPAPAEDRVASVLEAAGAPVDEDLLAAAAAVPDLSIIRLLEERGVLQSHSPRYSLAEPRPDAGETDEDISWRTEALATVVEWAEANAEDPYRILEEIDALLGMQRWAQQHERWDQVVRLGRAIEGALALAGRWSRWEDVLEAVLNAARVSADPDQEAWALHQLGSRAIGLDEADVARPLLLQALAIRVRIGDAHGAELTRQNLGFAGGAPDGGSGGGGPGPTRRWWLRILVALGVVAVVAGGVLGFLAIRDGTPTVEIGIDRDTLDFEDQRVREPSSALAVTVTSEGERPLSLQVRGPFGPHAGDFDLVNDTCSGARLAGGQACSIQVQFIPTATGDREATLVLRHNATDSPARVSLRGTGVSREEPAELVPGISIDPPTLAPFEDGGETRTVTVSSTGDAVLTFEASVVSDDDPEFFIDSETSSCVGSLDPDTDCLLVVAFDPRELGTGLAELVIESNAGGPLTLALSGTPRHEAPPEVRFFDTAEVPVRNSGSALLQLGSATIAMEDPADPVEFTIESTCTSLLIGATCSILVSFEPQGGSHQATLTVETNSPEGPVVVGLSGQVVD